MSKWKIHRLENVADVFQDARAKKKPDDTLVDELYQKIGRLEVELELDDLKQKSELFDEIKNDPLSIQTTRNFSVFVSAI